MSGQKTVLLGVTGCIAAYKSCEIVRSLQKAGMRVKVMMSEHATHFINPTTFRALTREPVAIGLFDAPSDPIHHISLAKEADVICIAPATANIIAKITYGLADDLFTTTVLASSAPLIVAPAMNVGMYEAEVTQRNLSLLRERGVRIVEAEQGYLACGDTGAGRLAEVDAIVSVIQEVLFQETSEGECAQLGCGEGRGEDLRGIHVLITAGPTYEPIDPVRFIGNRSSGKMGFALAEAARDRGARVSLVSGPVALGDPHDVSCVRVETAREMLVACESVSARADIIVCSAAVADMRPANEAKSKLKKEQNNEELRTIELVENPDILATLAAKRHPGQFIVGFAAETEELVRYAREKLVKKNVDLIVANKVGKTLTFGADESVATLINASGVRELPHMPKRALADLVLDEWVAARTVS